MISGALGSIAVMFCLGCSGLSTPGTDVVQIDMGPVSGSHAYVTRSDSSYADNDFGASDAQTFRLPLRVGNAFSPSNWAQPEQAGRFKQLDLSTPLPLRLHEGDNISAEVAFAASGKRTGLGLDLQVAPRAQFQRNRAGNNIANVGGEVRVGRGLADRDLRDTDARAPAWYFFVGADNQALVWNTADHQSLSGVTLRDQVTVGDMQAGLAWSTSGNSQMSLGLVQRKISFAGLTGARKVSSRESFVAFSFTKRY
ncbi:MAG: hypothetical protein GC155_03840 [Alphaproteobacteria bacterium]|nr:hypothetical protein [Alphaproteobacteria bacterium]